MYLVLVASPGVGKGQAIQRIREMLSSVEDIKIGDLSLTPAALSDALEKASRRIIRPTSNPALLSFNALSLIVDELGVLLPKYEPEMMNRLQHLWDGQPYSEARRTRDIEITIPFPCLNIIAGTTPDFLNSTLPEGAWSQGFISRTIMLYCGEQAILDADEMFIEPPSQESKKIALKKRLAEIVNLCGPMKFDPAAAEALKRWVRGGMEPVPTHPKLTHYLTRRLYHLIKLITVASVSCSSSLIIELPHVQRALDWLVEMEFYIPDIFKAMSSGGDTRVIEEAVYMIQTIFLQHKKPVPEARLWHYLSEHTPGHNIERIITIMIRAELIQRSGAGYVPRMRT